VRNTPKALTPTKPESSNSNLAQLALELWLTFWPELTTWDMIQILGRQAFVVTMTGEIGDTRGQGNLILTAEPDKPLLCGLTQNRRVRNSFFANQKTLHSFPSSNGKDYKACAVFLSHLTDGEQDLHSLLDEMCLSGESFGAILV